MGVTGWFVCSVVVAVDSCGVGVGLFRVKVVWVMVRGRRGVLLTDSIGVV